MIGLGSDKNNCFTEPSSLFKQTSLSRWYHVAFAKENIPSNQILSPSSQLRTEKCVIRPLKIFFSCKMNLLKPLCLPGEAPMGRIRENSAIYFYKRISCKFIRHSRLKILLKIEIQTCDEENLIKSHSSEKFCIFHPDINSVICLNPTKFSIQKKGNLGSSVYLLWIQTFLYILYRFR